MSAATPRRADEPEIPVRLVQLWLCDLCLDGTGGECHTPGCALWINRAPDLALRSSPMVTILDAVLEPQPAPGTVPAEALNIAWNALQHVALHTGDVKTAAKAREALRAVHEFVEDGTTEDGIDRTPRQPKPSPELAALRALHRIVGHFADTWAEDRATHSEGWIDEPLDVAAPELTGGQWTVAELSAALDSFYAWFTVAGGGARVQGRLLGADADEFARVLHAGLESGRGLCP
jgi:hypothetical protein